MSDKDKKEIVNPFQGLNLDLGALPLLSNARTRSLSAENPTGEKGGGAKKLPNPNEPGYSAAAVNLGKGWKVNPIIKIAKGDVVTIADVVGPGVIQHIWIGAMAKCLRQCILRFYWDGEDTPSVETPLSDFFATGHDIFARLNSLAVVVNGGSDAFGFNCYWPMPFKKRCKVTVENDGAQDQEYGGLIKKGDMILAYQITYAETEIPENIGYFHAQWRRSTTDRSRPEHVILDGVQGQGHYVGTFLAWTPLSDDGWWGEGEMKFFIDGDKEDPTICGTGTEDYFGSAGGFGGTYCTPFQGYPLWYKEPDRIPKHSLYRWHILDPIRFQNDLRVTIQALGWWPDSGGGQMGMLQPLADDIASEAYWYQSEPHATFPKFPPRDARWSRK